MLCEHEIKRFFAPLAFQNEGVKTKTSKMQVDCENMCAKLLVYATERLAPIVKRMHISQSKFFCDDFKPQLIKDKHALYSRGGLLSLPSGYSSLDASRPWIVYWTLHSMSLLKKPPVDLFPRCVDFLKRCQNRSGGFAGGPGQLSHLAPTYAAVLALCTIGTPEAYAVPDRGALYRWYISLQRKNGGFMMHHDGEVDVRGTYTLLAVARLLNILTPELCGNSADFVRRCQTFEGGFGGEPGVEAHGGYTFCGVAALVLLNRLELIDQRSLLRWLVHRQMRFEGGFQGRQNKLVDGCYSFWQGAVPALLQFGAKGEWGLLPYDTERLQRYIMFCCQVARGGLRDKPGMGCDYYHTCYCLSGLSIAQHGSRPEQVLGGAKNLLARTHPVFNVEEGKVAQALRFFESQPSSHAELMKM